MHEFGGTQDGVNRTGLNALGTPNAFVLPDVSDVRFFLLTVFRIEGLRLDIQQVSEGIYGFLTPGWTFVDCAALGNRSGIGFTPRMPTLPALCLW
jgi:hypothetical protein